LVPNRIYRLKRKIHAGSGGTELRAGMRPALQQIDTPVV